MPRMKVLNSIEQEAFEFPPVFNSAERKRHFDFPVGVSPTKVRKVPQDFCQQSGRKGFSAIPELPRRDLF